MSRRYDSYWPPYVPVAERRQRAATKVAKMKKSGRDVSPVEITGRKIASTFWGEAWCKNLEAYSDYSNRLPRGRTYVRNGSVIDLQIAAGHLRALVSGTDLYTVDIKIKPLAKKRWTEIKGHCAGQIDSLLELLQGSISKGVMEIVTRKGNGLFPSPREITLKCSCPDWATMCKHVAATLYGTGARLDQTPELLFTLRGVDPTEMVEAAVDQPLSRSKPRRGRALETEELSSIFGVDIDMEEVSPGEVSVSTKSTKKTKSTAVARSPATARASRKKVGTRPAKKKAAVSRKSTAKKSLPNKKVAKKTARKKAMTTTATATVTRKKTTKAGKKVGTRPTKKKTAASKKSTAKKPLPKKIARKAAHKKAMTMIVAATATKKKTTKKTGR